MIPIFSNTHFLTALTVEDDGLKPERHADLKVADKTTIAHNVSSFTKDSLLEPRTDLEIADKTTDNLHVPGIHLKYSNTLLYTTKNSNGPVNSMNKNFLFDQFLTII